VLSNFRGLAHKPRKREKKKKGGKEKVGRANRKQKGCRSVQHSCAVNYGE